MIRVLLSASYPIKEPFSLPEIDLAVRAIAEGVLERGHTLRFGGHPTITPLVLLWANVLRAGSQVEIYQSRFFEDSYTEEMRRLVATEGAKLTEVPQVGGASDDETRHLSVTAMRELMLSDPIDVAFFVGGRTGLSAEMEGLLQTSPSAECFLVRQPGGQARDLADGPQWPRVHILSGSAYDVLIADALSYVP